MAQGLFGIDESGMHLSVLGLLEDYDPGITAEIDKKIRFMTPVVAMTQKKARDLLAATHSENFDITFDDDPNRSSRPRAWVHPKNGKGIREEKTKSVLLKAALGMTGK